MLNQIMFCCQFGCVQLPDLSLCLICNQEIGKCEALLEKESVALNTQLGILKVLVLHLDLGAATQRVYDTGSEVKESGNQGDSGKSRRRVILTDILGEASFTLSNIRYVIDTGLQLKTVSLCPWNFSFSSACLFNSVSLTLCLSSACSLDYMCYSIATCSSILCPCLLFCEYHMCLSLAGCVVRCANLLGVDAHMNIFRRHCTLIVLIAEIPTAIVS